MLELGICVFAMLTRQHRSGVLTHYRAIFSQGWEFALSLFALFTFSNTSHKSDLLFLRVGKLKTGLKNVYHIFLHCFYKKHREQITLLKKATGANHSCRSFNSKRAMHCFKKRERTIHSFCQKRAITKIKRAISQPDFPKAKIFM